MLIRILATGQVIDMIEVAAMAKIDAGMAVRVETQRETSAIDRAIETGARVLKETFRKPTDQAATQVRHEPNQVVRDMEDNALLFTGRRPRRHANIIET